MGIFESLISAVCGALNKGVGRKNLVAITAMVILAQMTDGPLWLSVMVLTVAVAVILTQWDLDRYEVRITGKDLPDNGHPTIIVTGDKKDGPDVSS